MSATEPLLVGRDGSVVTLTINNPPHNAMGLELMDELERVVEELSGDRSCRAVVVTAAGDEHFSVGMNLKEMPEGIRRMGSVEAVLDQRLRVLAAIENLDKPVIATLYGYCLGGGLELPLACHFRLAAEEGAQIGLPEIDLGTVPAWGGTARLTRCVGRDHALDMILRAKKYSGPEALRIGLVQEVWPKEELKQRAHSLAEDMAAGPAAAISGVLRAIVGSEDRTLEEALTAEREAVMRTMGTPDQAEGMRAFMEKRRPRFGGE